MLGTGGAYSFWVLFLETCADTKNLDTGEVISTNDVVHTMVFSQVPNTWHTMTHDIVMTSGDIEHIRVDLIFENAQGTVLWDEVTAVANPESLHYLSLEDFSFSFCLPFISLSFSRSLCFVCPLIWRDRSSSPQSSATAPMGTTTR